MKAFKKLKGKLSKQVIKSKSNEGSEDDEDDSLKAGEGSLALSEVTGEAVGLEPSPPPAPLSRSLNSSMGAPPSLNTVKLMPKVKMPPGFNGGGGFAMKKMIPAGKMPASGIKIPPGVQPPFQKQSPSPSEFVLSAPPSQLPSRRQSFGFPPSSSSVPDGPFRSGSMGNGSFSSMKLVPVSRPPGVPVDQPQILSRAHSLSLSEDRRSIGGTNSIAPSVRSVSKKMISVPGNIAGNKIPMGLRTPIGNGGKMLVGVKRPVPAGGQSPPAPMGLGMGKKIAMQGKVPVGPSKKMVVPPKKMMPFKKVINPPKQLSEPGSPASPIEFLSDHSEEMDLELGSSSSSSIQLEQGSPHTVKLGAEEKVETGDGVRGGGDTQGDMSISISSNDTHSLTILPQPSVNPVTPKEDHSIGFKSQTPSRKVSLELSGPSAGGITPELSKPSSRSATPISAPQDTVAAPPLPLTRELRRRIIEELSSVISPHQYYGKIVKVVGIQPLGKTNNSQRSIPRNNNEGHALCVATKDMDSSSSQYFSQLKLFDADALPSPNFKETGCVETPITLYNAFTSKMLFSTSELDAKRLLQGSPQGTSCYVTSSGSIVFKDPGIDLTPLAKLKIRWIPYSCPQSEPQCPIHQKEMQLFDPYSRKLVCALCASKQPASLNHLVVIPDVLTPHSRTSIVESVNRQRESALRVSKMWVSQHERVIKMATNKRTAIQQQFDLLLAAIDTKKKEFLEACDAEFDVALSDIVREIVTAGEKSDVLAAASYHLESKSSLYSLQIATIAEGLEASRVFPSKFSRASLKIPTLSTGVMPNLEGVMSEVHALNPNSIPVPVQKIDFSSDAASRSDTEDRIHSSRVDMFRSPTRCIKDRPAPSSDLHRVTIVRRVSDDQADHLLSGNRMSREIFRYGRSSSSPSPDMQPKEGCRRRRSNSVELGGDRRLKTSTSIPNSSGTALFDYPVHPFWSDHNPGSATRLPHYERTVQWSFRVHDYGDWVGIGVGVGMLIDSFVRASTNDLSHLWIVPFGAEGETYHLRVTEYNGQAKLSIHDRRGKQLDDGRIPQWNAQRPCYPQATFGGKVGRIELVDPPHLL